MLIDSLYRLIEKDPKALPEFVVKFALRAEVFRFLGKYHEIPDTMWKPEEREKAVNFLSHTFTVPFGAVVIEDETSPVLICDTTEDAVGLKPRRFFLEVKGLGTNGTRNFATVHRHDEPCAGDYFEQLVKSHCSSRITDDHYAVIWGFIQDLEFVRKEEGDHQASFSVQTDGCSGLIFSKSEGKLLCKYYGDRLDDHFKHSARSSVLALEELMWFNNPSRWLLKRQSLNSEKYQAKAGKLGRILRSDHRPVYTSMTPGEIRDLFRRSQDYRCDWEVMLHNRKSHVRQLKAAKYLKNGALERWTTVKACWVGPEEAVVNNTRCTVMVHM